MDQLSYPLLFAGGLLAGVINVMAGGAGFMTFPLLLAAGLTEMEANACNFVALVAPNLVGTWVYRRDLLAVRRHLPLRLLIAGTGGTLGSLLFVRLGEASFHRAIPWLLLFATMSFALGPLIKRGLEKGFAFDGTRWLWLCLVLEFLVYVYGGYFGLGMGIILFALYAIFTTMDMHQSNAVRNVTIALMTVIGIVIFWGSGLVRWLPALTMMAGAASGGYAMARFARAVPQEKIRIGILAWATLLTGFAFWRYG